jgi:hypothetical protein
MPNILSIPNSSTIFFSSDTAGASTSPALTGNAVSLAHNGSAGLTISSLNTSSLSRLQINGANGSLFAVTDAVTGTVFTVNDASGLPIVSVDTGLNDVINIGTFGSNALVVRNDRVGIGQLNPNVSAALDIVSTTRGFLPPRMTTTQRDAISSPPDGLQVYNTSTNRINVRSVSSSVPTWLEVPAVTTGVASFLTAPTSENLAAAVTDETGTGSLVFGTSPTISGATISGATKESPFNIGNSGTSVPLSLANGTFQQVTLTGNCTFTMPTAVSGSSFTLQIFTGNGSFTGTFTGIAPVRWQGAISPTLTTTPSRVDIASFLSDGTNWYGSIAQNYTV